MEKIYLTIGTVTRAMLARDVLREKGIDAAAAKTPAGLSRMGCSYSVVVRGDAVTRTKEILADRGIQVTGVYKGRF